MELLIFGHSGAKVMMFPTRDGRFFEYEELGLVDSMADKVEAGHLQLYCIEGLAKETFYAAYNHPAERIRRHAAFEDYILNEVLPLMAEKTRMVIPSCRAAVSARFRPPASSFVTHIFSASSSPFPAATI